MTTVSPLYSFVRNRRRFWPLESTECLSSYQRLPGGPENIEIEVSLTFAFDSSYVMATFTVFRQNGMINVSLLLVDELARLNAF